MQRLEKDQKKELAAILHCRTTQEKTLSSNMLNPVGIHRILKSLEPDELKLFKAIYDNNEEVKNFNTLEKKIHLSVSQIDRCSTSLSKKALIYVIKNRQLLTNKMDKIYLIKEIADQLNFIGTTEVLEDLTKLHNMLQNKKSGESRGKNTKPDKKGEALLVELIEAGGLLPLEKILENEKYQASFEKFLTEGIIRLAHVTSHPDISVVILTPSAVPLLRDISLKSSADTTLAVNNHYRMILNLLLAYDIISTFGLFLTKQNQIRKIDLKRISDSLVKTRTMSGEENDREELAGLILYWFNAIENTKIQRDVASITLRPIQKDLENPAALIIKLFHAMDKRDKVAEVFRPSNKLPSYRALTGILKIIEALRVTDAEYLRWTIHSGRLASSGKKNFYRLLEDTPAIFNEITEELNILCLTGVIALEHGKIVITDIGEEVAHRLFKTPFTKDEEKITPSIYINPDFTLILAENELPSIALYHIMAHTDIGNDDVIIHTTITRESIIRAHKRGLSLENFLNTLDAYARNKIPQNLIFLLSEWAKQTISVTMKRVILMETDHPSFLDEIIYGQKDDSLIKRISPNHAIVAKDFIETVVKKARKKDAAISLFEEEDDIE